MAAASLTPAVARARFAVFVDRAMRDARVRGETDRSIARKSDVATSTFHRWRKAEGRGLPELDKVRRFCDATGASLDDALAALGLTGEEPQATPEPPLPRDVRIILRRLADPNTPERERDFIRQSLSMLAERAAVELRRDERRDAV